MVKVLTDVHLSEGLIELQQNNKSLLNDMEYKKSIVAAVLVKNGVTMAQYDSSLIWYSQNLKNLIKVYEKVDKNLADSIDYWTERGNDIFKEFGVSPAGDNVDLWTIKNYLTLDESILASLKVWSIPADSNYVAGDSFVWKFRVPYVPKNHYMFASIALAYSSDTTCIFDNVVIHRDTTVTLRCKSRNDSIFDNMYLSVGLLKDSISASDCSAFIDDISLKRLR